MALITCGKCGKRVSNTRSTCFKCGAKIYFEEPIAVDIPVTNEFEDLPEEATPVFSALSESEQLELENEFLRKDKWAKKYRRLGAEAKAFGGFTGFIFIFARLLYLLQNYIIANSFGGSIYQPNLIELSKHILAAVALLLCLTSIIMCIYSCIAFKSKFKKCLYMKKFQKWLKNEKSIDYFPNLITEEERKFFEQLDTDTIEC